MQVFAYQGTVADEYPKQRSRLSAKDVETAYDPQGGVSILLHFFEVAWLMPVNGVAGNYGHEVRG